MTDPINTQSISSGTPGDLVLRLVARIIDGILLLIVTFVLGFALLDLNSTLVGMLSAVISFAYYVFMDSQYGFTVGKKALGLSVRGPSGGKPTLEQAAIRESFNLLSIIPFLGGVLGFFAAIAIAVTIAMSPTKQGVHDQIAKGTAVIKG